MLENMAEYSMFGSEPFRVFRVNQDIAVKNWAEHLGKQFGKYATPEEAGILVQSAIKRKHEIFNRDSGFSGLPFLFLLLFVSLLYYAYVYAK